jgi:hypothetical protein
MAPSNLNQVFVMNGSAVAAGVDFNRVATAGALYSSLAVASNRGGVWTRPILTGTQTYTAAALFSGTGATAGTITAAPGGGLGLDFFQVVQGTNKNLPIATPLISPRDVRRIKASAYAATQRHQEAFTFAATIPAAVSTISGSVMVKCDIRVAPTFYEMFSNPSNANLDLSGGGFAFPILGNFSAGRTMIPIVELAPGTTAANCAIAVGNAITGNTILNAIFAVTVAGAGVTIIARHPGVIFDIAIFDTVAKVSSANFTASVGGGAFAITTTGFNAGVGNYWQVISAEKSQRARYGNFNRMYFPFEQPNYAQVGSTYDAIEVSYEHNWPSSTGIARAGELNNFTIYCPGGLATYGVVFGGTAAFETNFGGI